MSVRPWPPQKQRNLAKATHEWEGNDLPRCIIALESQSVADTIFSLTYFLEHRGNIIYIGYTTCMLYSPLGYTLLLFCFIYSWTSLILFGVHLYWTMICVEFRRLYVYLSLHTSLLFWVGVLGMDGLIISRPLIHIIFWIFW